MDYDAIAKAGSMLGSGAVIVMDDSRCMVRSLLRLSYFYQHESCGQCTPCREGTGWLWRLVDRIEHGKGRAEDLDLLDSVADNIKGRTICALGDAAAMPVQGMLKHFRDEFAYHVEHKTCMVGAHGRTSPAMIEIELDGKKVSVAEGSMVMHAADAAGAYIPHFCYHKKLSIAANCRMCLVDIEKMPKPMPACATPATNGMVVRSKSDKAVKAQQSVMEFLLINHPLDCPICDQGGECQLQDLAVGYGKSASRYTEEKRVVFHKDVGPLISMEEMSRCIHCTRCVRFGQEVAGVMELGMIHRGEHSEITTIAGRTIDSELSGNMIDICPVGALTSKPFRYSARTWELNRRQSVSPHDSVGANLVVQVKGGKVMRVVPLENEDVNECWIADRDRFSYEALNSDSPADAADDQAGRRMAGGRLEDRAGLRRRRPEARQGRVRRRAGIGAIGHASSTAEELHLLAKLVRGLGSESIDHRTRHADFAQCGARRPCALARHLDRLAVEARPRLRHRLLPAQGPSAAGAAPAPGRAPWRATGEPARRARRLGDAAGRHADRRTRSLAGAAGRRRRRGGQGAGCARAAAGRPRRRCAGRRRRAAVRRAQGHPARQRCGAAPAGFAVAGAGGMDRRAHRCQRGLPGRIRQRRRRAARRRAAGCRRPARRPDAEPADEGAAAAEYRAGARQRRRRRSTPGAGRRRAWWWRSRLSRTRPPTSPT